MRVRTSLRLKFCGELFGRDLHVSLLLVLSAVPVVAVVDHIEKVIEFIIILERAESVLIMVDIILIIRIIITCRRIAIRINRIAEDATPDLGRVAKADETTPITEFTD